MFRTAFRDHLWRGLLGILILGAISACGFGGSSVLVKGAPLPRFELADLAGGTLDSEDLRGDVTVINFWATWCGPCRREIPALREIGRSTRVVAITLDDASNQAAVRDFIERERIAYRVLQGDNRLAGQLGIRSIPYTVVVDSELKVVATYRGVVSESRLQKAIDKAV